MKKIFTLSLLTAAFGLQAQTTFWNENFGTGCNRGQLVPAFASINGAWTQSATGTNDPYADEFYVSATASGTGGQNCSDNCLLNPSETSRSLHIGNAAVALAGIGADTGSTYLTGVFCGLGICSVTNKRVESPLINCQGHNNIALSFIYYEGGEATDNATVEFSSDGGGTWSTIDQLPKTSIANCTAPSGLWVEYQVNLPASANNNGNVKVGFKWVNDNNAQGSDPSFAVDDMALTDNISMGISVLIEMQTSVYASDANTVMINTSGRNWKFVSAFDATGRSIQPATESSSLLFNHLSPGIYFVAIDVEGQRVTRKLLLGYGE